MTRPVPHATLTVPLSATDHAVGPVSARVTVIEYGDFECPFCAQAYSAVKIFEKQFAGRIRFAYRHFPLLEEHPHAEFAAEAAEAAGAQGRFWPMHDRLFERQQHLKPHDLRAHAQALELDMARYDAEMADRIYLQRVQEQREGGRASGIRGTPAFFLNDVGIDASYGMAHVVDAIEQALR
jgi:protein-disulfide isomerase